MSVLQRTDEHREAILERGFVVCRRRACKKGRVGPGTGSGCWLVRRAPPRGLRLEELAGEVWGDSAKNKVANYFKVMKDRMQ